MLLHIASQEGCADMPVEIDLFSILELADVASSSLESGANMDEANHNVITQFPWACSSLVILLRTGRLQ
jgi:hypothetical protein